MFNIGQLSQTVQHNCHISDALHAGKYTLCIFLLKMREYYRWEHDYPLTKSLEKKEVGDWIVARETAWQDIEEENYLPIRLPGGDYDPFDTEAINKELIPHGYIYSSGLGVFSKPHFFLAELTAVERHGDVTIYTSDWEYARDMVAPPAMTRENAVFVRQEPLRRVIWEKIEEWAWKKDLNTPMGRMLAPYIANNQLESALDIFTANEIANLTLHEIGEAEAGRLLGPSWEEMLIELPRSSAEFKIRAVRDHLADALRTLPSIISSRNAESLHFYIANLTDLRKALFPELVAFYQQWVTDENWTKLDNSLKQNQDRWLTLAKKILAAYHDDDKTFDQQITQLVGL